MILVKEAWCLVCSFQDIYYKCVICECPVFVGVVAVVNICFTAIFGLKFFPLNIAPFCTDWRIQHKWLWPFPYMILIWNSFFFYCLFVERKTVTLATDSIIEIQCEILFVVFILPSVYALNWVVISYLTCDRKIQSHNFRSNWILKHYSVTYLPEFRWLIDNLMSEEWASFFVCSCLKRLVPSHITVCLYVYVRVRQYSWTLAVRAIVYIGWIGHFPFHINIQLHECPTKRSIKSKGLIF